MRGAGAFAVDRKLWPQAPPGPARRSIAGLCQGLCRGQALSLPAAGCLMTSAVSSPALCWGRPQGHTPRWIRIISLPQGHTLRSAQATVSAGVLRRLSSR